MSDPKFKVGDVLRYHWGETALFRVDHVSVNHGGFDHRYYGRHVMGGTQGAYEENCRPASAKDLLVWVFHRGKDPKPLEPFVVKHYVGDERCELKGNGFDGLELGADRAEAERFVAWLNKHLRLP